MVNFTDALNTKQSDVEKPARQPQGTYRWRVSKIPAIIEREDWTIIEFPVQALEAEDDVDPDDLAEFGPVSGAVNRIAFMAPTDPEKENDRKKTLFNLTRFLRETLVVDCEADATVKEMLDASVGCELLAQIVWSPNPKDPDDPYVNLKSWAPID